MRRGEESAVEGDGGATWSESIRHGRHGKEKQFAQTDREGKIWQYVCSERGGLSGMIYTGSYGHGLMVG